MFNNNHQIKKYIPLLSVTVIVILVLIFANISRLVNLNHYNSGVELYSKKNYIGAKKEFERKADFKLSSSYIYIIDCRIILEEIKELILKGDSDKAYENINSIDEEKMTNNAESIGDGELESEYQSVKYELALTLMKNKQFEKAESLFASMGLYKDSELYANQIEVKSLEAKREKLYNLAIEKYNLGEYKEAYNTFKLLEDFKDSESWKAKSESEIRKKDLNSVIAAGIKNSISIGYNHRVLYTNNEIDGIRNCDEWNDIISVDTYHKLIIGLSMGNKAFVAGKYGDKEIDVSLWPKIIDVSAGEQFVVGLDENGKVHAAGHNGDGQCKVESWENVIDVDAGWRFTVGLTSDGQLLFAGHDGKQKEDYQKKKEKWKDVIKISASGGEVSAFNSDGRGNGHTVGLKKDGTVVAIGDNSRGQCDVENWKDVVRVSAGDWYTVGLKSDGSILITGNNFLNTYYIDSKIISELKDVIDIAAGYGQTLCLKKDGTIISFGFDDSGKVSNVGKWEKSLTLDDIIETSIINNH